jgi:hypothetical protein
MKLAVTLLIADSVNDFNALRLGNFASTQDDEVGVFLIATGVDLEQAADSRFDVVSHMLIYSDRQ